MDDFIERIQRMGRAIAPYAKAKAERVYIEQFRKSKKALLMGECKETTAVAREQYAYAHPEYIALLESLKAATALEEKTKWSLEKFKIEFSHWQTLQANDRWMKNRV